MLDLEHKLLQRWSPATFLKTGVLVMLLGAAPLLLYALLGPADGNPIGLGLLMVVAVPVGFLLFGVGLLRLLIGWRAHEWAHEAVRRPRRAARPVHRVLHLARQHVRQERRRRPQLAARRRSTRLLDADRDLRRAQRVAGGWF